MKRLNKKGVSLAELLAVVVIMGIIAAIAIPLVGNVIETTKKNAWIGDARSLQSATVTYCQVNSTTDFCSGTTNAPLALKAATVTGEAAVLQAFISKNFNSDKYETVEVHRNSSSSFSLKMKGNGFECLGDDNTLTTFDPLDEDLVVTKIPTAS